MSVQAVVQHLKQSEPNQVQEIEQRKAIAQILDRKDRYSTHPDFPIMRMSYAALNAAMACLKAELPTVSLKTT